MARSIKLSCPASPDGVDPGCHTKKYKVELITPLFGGGVETGIHDPITLVRSSSIRGHLRFWWRATRGASFQSVAALRQREGEIWGTTENPSPVGIVVKMINEAAPKPCATCDGDKLVWNTLFAERNPALSYALFPFQGSAPDSDKSEYPTKFVESANFLLEVSIPTEERMAKLRAAYNELRNKKNLPGLTEQDDDIQRDVEAAVWAWVNFGGLGARTRRGCGALFCKEFAPLSFGNIGAWFESGCREYGISRSIGIDQWPSLINSPLILNRTGSPLDAWSDAVRWMREFRQGATGRDGRSLWPEADSLRAITTGKGKSQHRSSNTLAEPINPDTDSAFPRAELGLPIVFHFKDSEDRPNDCELYPKGSKRMASPVILRPLAIGNGKQAVPMVLQLNGPRPQELEISGLESAPSLLSRNIRRPELGEYFGSPLKRSSEGSALDAFIAFVKAQGFSEPQP